MKTLAFIVGILAFFALGFLMGRKKVEFDHLKAVKFAALWMLLLLFVSTMMGYEATEPISLTHEKMLDEWVGWAPMLDAGMMKEKVYEKVQQGEISPCQAYEALSLINYIDDQ